MNRRDDSAPLAAGTAPQIMGVERPGAAAGGAESALNGAPTDAPPERAEEPPKKRAKLAALDDISVLRKRILDHKLLRIKHYRDRFTEQLSELYFLQAGGNMMDYVAWRKRPPTPQLAAFLEARRPPAGVPAVTAPPALPAAPVTSAAPQEVVDKAKKEAEVATRVADLVRAGLWSERRLPRVLEPPRPKSHWDYLLEEMAWLAQDFAHERKWKKQAAKKCARAVQKYFQDKAVAAQKAEKAQELQLRKIASFAAKEIRTFWANVEKIVEWKRVRRVERVRKEALDEQLSYIVDRTERYSRQLAANLQPSESSRPPSDAEFEPRGESDDDEETIAAAEREAAHDAAHHRAELEALQRESRLELGELLPPGYLRAHSPPPSDYSADEDSADDEDTIAEQERAERGRDANAELDELRGDAEMDLDELMRRYSAPPPDAGDRSSTDEEEQEQEEGEEEEEEEETEHTEESDDGDSLGALVEDEKSDKDDKGADGEQRVEAAACLAATLQPTGTTLSETAVGTPVPRLLRHALREYQHVGLHWLATMYSRGLNGILADEMGLGKTIQTIALLAHLALDRHDWGPHLVVAPTSVVLNWEMEFKKWCPAFKLLTYYGTIKERKLKRVGWTKANSFHVCITSYKLVVQDHQSFRRKRWKYLILDEAQNIKNFKSQRWQMLLNFQTERRLLLTGTPLQNSLLELWSLMHFLMPDVFASHSEFREWFNPVAGLAEGAERSGESQQLVRRLHEVLRPFLLRRLKADVERQMPRKYEHVLMCRLSKRQRFLYDDFMARAKTKETLASGNLLSVINVLMQLRKVCNHPDLFEPRPVASPLQLVPLRYCVPALALRAGCEWRARFAARFGGDLASLEASGADAFAAHRARHLAPPRRLFDEIDDAAVVEPLRPPPAALRLHLRLVPRAPPALPPGPPPPIAPAAAPPPPPPPPAPAPSPAISASAARLQARRRACLRRLATMNERRCWRMPLLGADLRRAVCSPPPEPPAALAPGDIAHFVERMYDTIDRFSVCCLGARTSAVQLVAGCGAGEWRRRAAQAEAGVAAEAARALLRELHVSASRQAVAFPHPRLLQYDCGKLQTLDGLLRRLKAGGHRVLIFTQMTRVLDVLEAFLSMHGHAYLRLDGTTRVDRRQPLVDRFNADRRVFAFILSTRSGGVGLNLTGADAVVFYDSDWNPTMDAQAQDRCHRIGQTRDVHVYRLVTAATVEENILRKAEQKRALGQLAIDGGHFTTSYLRGATVRELFGTEAGVAADSEAAAPCELESALAAAEDEADAAAARRARNEQQAELAEFDESVPLPDEDSLGSQAHTQKRPTDELAQLMEQLTPIEKYAMRVVEKSETATEAERAALEQMQRQLREWEQARRALRDESPPPADRQPPEAELTYCREDARTQVWVSGLGAEVERMPMWCPPTPPSSEGEVYCERWARALYRPGAAADALLPPVQRRERAPRSPRRAPRAPSRAAHAPASLFGARTRPRLRLVGTPHRDSPQAEWTPCEDAALRQALRQQMMLADSHAALAPNWEWVADSVNDVSRTFRSARPCRDRHDALADPERARRKQKKPPAARRRADDDAPRPPLHAMDAKRDRADRRRQTLKRRLEDSSHPSSKHAALMADHGVDLDSPLTPVEVATRRAERIAKEKQKAGGAPAPAGSTTAPAVGAAPAPVAAVAAQAAASPQRVLLAGTEARRVSAASPAAQLLYRHQSLAARPGLKLLQHAQAVVSGGGGAGGAGEQTQTGTLHLHRNLQLQHLQQMRRSLPAGVTRATAAPRLLAPRHTAPSHVVLAHLPPEAPPAPPERH